MKSLQRIFDWLRGGCVYFTLLALLMLFINLALAGGEAVNYVKVSSFLLFFPCGLGISLADCFRKSKVLPGWGRMLLHSATVTLSLLLFLWLPANSQARASTAFLLFAAFTILYWICYLLIHLIGNRIRRLLDED